MERLDALVRDASEADIERRRERVERMGKGRSGKMKGGKGKGKGGKGKEKGGKGKVEGGGGNEGDGWEMSGGLGM